MSKTTAHELEDKLEPKHFWAYSLGHFLNDLSANSWINFSVFFLARIVQTDCASIVFMAGQLADGIATPLVGTVSDKCDSKVGIFFKIQAKEFLGMCSECLC